MRDAEHQHDLWKNVLSRLEVRWDHQAGDGEMVGYGGDNNCNNINLRDSVPIAANFI